MVKNSKILESKILSDPVHGFLTLHPLVVTIIDTPQFQRLRYIHQTGFSNYVYPGSIHDRFGHSVGVAFLAGIFLRRLRDRQPELGISDAEILSVEIAGLCHDLGHGPFSHTWEVFMGHAASATKSDISPWKHEQVSLNILDYLILSNDLKPVFKFWGIKDEDILAIKSMIRGKVYNKNRAFLYQVVNNEDSGLDVDKWDYFLRDCFYSGFPCDFDYHRLINFARINYLDGVPIICFRDKEASNVLNVFRTRSILHHQVYQHRVSLLIDHLFVEAVSLSDGTVLFGPQQEAMKAYEWSIQATEPLLPGHEEDFFERMENYCQLTDTSLMGAISHNSGKSCLVRKAQEILESFYLSRNFTESFYYVGKIALESDTEAHGIPKKEDVLHGLLCFRVQVLEELKLECSEEAYSDEAIRNQLIIQVVTINWGKGAKNPVDYVYFFSKNKQSVAQKYIRQACHLDFPKSFENVHAEIYLKQKLPQDDNLLKITEACFLKYSVMVEANCFS